MDRKAPPSFASSAFVQIAAIAVAILTPLSFLAIFPTLRFNSDFDVSMGDWTKPAVWLTVAMAVLNYYMLSIAGNNVFNAMIRHLVMIASFFFGVVLLISAIGISSVYWHLLFALVMVNANWIFAGSRVD